MKIQKMIKAFKEIKTKNDEERREACSKLFDAIAGEFDDSVCKDCINKIKDSLYMISSELIRLKTRQQQLNEEYDNQLEYTKEVFYDYIASSVDYKDYEDLTTEELEKLNSYSISKADYESIVKEQKANS